MFSDKIQGIIGTVAPTIATALGGPLAGVAVKALSSALFGNEDTPPDEIETALHAANPETLLKIKTSEQDFKVKLRELGIREDQLHAQDRDSARKRDVESGDNVNRNLAYALTTAFIGAVGGLLFWGLPDGVTVQEATLIGSCIGYLSAKVEQIVAYYFGSSKGSREKSRQQHLLAVQAASVAKHKGDS